MATRRTTTGRFWTAALAAVVSVAGWPPATAQPADELTVEVGDCVELTSPAERLACFEAQVEAARKERSPAREPAPAPEPSVRAPQPSVRAPEPSVRAPAPSTPAPAVASADRARPPAVREEPVRVERNRRSEDQREANERAPAEIVATVAELRETVPDSYMITLDNGQVWRQSRPARYPLQRGSAVRIYPTERWGYRLTNADARGFIQVERVR